MKRNSNNKPIYDLEKYGLGDFIRQHGFSASLGPAGIIADAVTGGKASNYINKSAPAILGVAGNIVAPGVGGQVGSQVGNIVAQDQQLRDDEAASNKALASQMNQNAIRNRLSQSNDYQPTLFGDGGLMGNDYFSSWENIGESQGKLTKALAKKYPNVPIDSIVNEYSKVENFSNKNLDEYANELTKKYGDIYLSEEEVSKTEPNYYKYLNVLRKGDNITTQGATDTRTTPKFGYRSMLERRYKQGQPVYNYLAGNDEYAMGGILNIEGNSHANGGIATNNGVPVSITGNEPTEELEGGEKLVRVTESIRNNLIKQTKEGKYNGKIPQVGESYVLSKKNGTAEMFNKVRNKYKLRLDENDNPLDNTTKSGFNNEIASLIGVNEDFKNGLNEYMQDVEYKEGGTIHIKPENKGKFTAWAKSHGKSVQEAAKMVMAHKDKYSSTIVKRANFARQAKRWKHEAGGYLEGGTYDLDDSSIKNLIKQGYEIEYI